MKVKQLIKLLSKLNPNAELVYCWSRYMDYYPLELNSSSFGDEMRYNLKHQSLFPNQLDLNYHDTQEDFLADKKGSVKAIEIFLPEDEG